MTKQGSTNSQPLTWQRLEISDEMIDAGVRVLQRYSGGSVSDHFVVEEIYIAMANVSRKEKALGQCDLTQCQN